MSIRLSPNHGINPAIPKCFFCLKDKNMVILPGRLKGDAKAPYGAVWDMEPCDECREHMKMGIILISCKDPSPGKGNNPYRTGGWVVVAEDYIRRAITPELAQIICESRFAFVPDDAWDKMGLPRGPLESA